MTGFFVFSFFFFAYFCPGMFADSLFHHAPYEQWKKAVLISSLLGSLSCLVGVCWLFR